MWTRGTSACHLRCAPLRRSCVGLDSFEDRMLLSGFRWEQHKPDCVTLQLVVFIMGHLQCPPEIFGSICVCPLESWLLKWEDLQQSQPCDTVVSAIIQPLPCVKAYVRSERFAPERDHLLFLGPFSGLQPRDAGYSAQPISVETCHKSRIQLILFSLHATVVILPCLPI